MAWKRLPFTLIMFLVLILLGIYGQTHVGPLDVDIHRQVGYSPRLLVEGQTHRLITSAFFTLGGWMFYVSLVMFVLGVGWTEWIYGTSTAVTVFWASHLATLLILSLLISLPLVALGWAHSELLYNLRDVGPSAGYFGCLSYVIAGLSKVRRWMAGGLLLVLLARLGWSLGNLPESGHHYVADAAHLIAVFVGLGCMSTSVWFAGRRQ